MWIYPNLKMRELLPILARQQGERITSLHGSSSSTFPVTSFSIQTSKRFPFFHVVKYCRYSTMLGEAINLVYIPQKLVWGSKVKAESTLLFDVNNPKRFKVLFSCVQWRHPCVLCVQVWGRERLLLQSEVDRLQHHWHAGSWWLWTRWASTTCSVLQHYTNYQINKLNCRWLIKDLIFFLKVKKLECLWLRLV